MAIAKLNKNFKNEGEPGYEQTPFEAKEANDICNTIDKLIDKSEKATFIESGDFNTVPLESGTFLMQKGPKNSPKTNSTADDHWILQQFFCVNSIILQIASHAWEANYKGLYMRRKIGSNWSSWTDISNTDTSLYDFSLNGFFKHESGFAVVWGNEEITLTSTNQEASITFPKKFTKCLQVVATLSDPGGGKNNFTTGIGVQIFSSTSANLRIKSTADYVANRAITVRYVAIGVM